MGSGERQGAVSGNALERSAIGEGPLSVVRLDNFSSFEKRIGIKR